MKASTRRIAFACFTCPASFKRDDENESAKCPNCGGPLHRMGWSFHAPPKSDSEQWKKVQILYAEGFRFQGSGGRGAPPLPSRLRDVSQFVSENKDHVLRVAPRRAELLP
jgi:hypothetical protein